MTEKQLIRIEQAALDLQRAEERLYDEVDRARREGATWKEIGDLFGITRQAAQQRWG